VNRQWTLTRLNHSSVYPAGQCSVGRVLFKIGDLAAQLHVVQLFRNTGGAFFAVFVEARVVCQRPLHKFHNSARRSPNQFQELHANLRKELQPRGRAEELEVEYIAAC
jgi:hypothetical protein